MKNPSQDAQVILAKCNRTHQPFGITVERKSDGAWHCIWAFKLSEKSANDEGYGDITVSGRVVLDSEYPGCPYCGAQRWFSCDCGKLTCLDGESPTATCAWCGNSGELITSESHNLRGGGY